MTSVIYRYKFSPEFTNHLLAFINIHRFDPVASFKEAWDLWYATNEEMVQRETDRLMDLGYIGNIGDKMYKSARYYYKNKPLGDKSAKKRRKYVRLDSDILSIMDVHIGGHREKPSISYKIFIEGNGEKIKLLTADLIEKGLKKEDIEIKIKKTFKNRYFRLMGN